MARFDYVDRPGPHNLRVYLRSLDRIEVRWRGEASLRLWLLLRGEGGSCHQSISWSFSARLRPSLPLCKADDEAPKRRCGSYQGAREALAWGGGHEREAQSVFLRGGSPGFETPSEDEELVRGLSLMGRRRTAAAQAGTEIVQSYFPLNLHYSERQQRTRDLYGFVRPALSVIMSRSPPSS